MSVVVQGRSALAAPATGMIGGVMVSVAAPADTVASAVTVNCCWNGSTCLVTGLTAFTAVAADPIVNTVPAFTVLPVQPPVTSDMVPGMASVFITADHVVLCAPVTVAGASRLPGPTNVG